MLSCFSCVGFIVFKIVGVPQQSCDNSLALLSLCGLQEAPRRLQTRGSIVQLQITLTIIITIIVVIIVIIISSITIIIISSSSSSISSSISSITISINITIITIITIIIAHSSGRLEEALFTTTTNYY